MFRVHHGPSVLTFSLEKRPSSRFGSSRVARKFSPSPPRSNWRVARFWLIAVAIDESFSRYMRTLDSSKDVMITRYRPFGKVCIKLSDDESHLAKDAKNSLDYTHLREHASGRWNVHCAPGRITGVGMKS
jgi:hypothetical protein